MNPESLEQLNGFLRSELSAVEIYRQAVRAVVDHEVRGSLYECLRSHEKRAAVLLAEIHQHGGVPASASSCWSGFARLEACGDLFVFVEADAAAAALAALEEGEDRGKMAYIRELNQASGRARTLVREVLLPEQVRTHDTLKKLVRVIH